MRIPPVPPTLCLAFIVGLFAAPDSVLVARAEPIALHSVDSAPQGPLAGIELPPSESGLPIEFDGDQENTDDATAPPPSPGDRRAAQARRRTGQPRSTQAADVARETSSARLAAMLDDEADWEREIREAMRPYYEQIAASGVADAVHGLKSQLSLSIAAASADETAASTDYRTAPGIAPWESRDERFDAQGREKSPDQIESEKKITAQLIDEWIAAVKPWFIGLAALYALWQVTKLGFDFSRWKTARAFKRRAKKPPSHRATHGRRAPSRR